MRILVVDDEPRLAAALKRGLVAEGFAVDTSGLRGVSSTVRIPTRQSPVAARVS